MAVHEFGNGALVFNISGLPYSFENSCILYRSILWSTHGEKDLHQWFSSNFNVEVHAYVKKWQVHAWSTIHMPARKLWFIVVMAVVFLWKMEANEIKMV